MSYPRFQNPLITHRISRIHSPSLASSPRLSASSPRLSLPLSVSRIISPSLEAYPHLSRLLPVLRILPRLKNLSPVSRILSASHAFSPGLKNPFCLGFFPHFQTPPPCLSSFSKSSHPLPVSLCLLLVSRVTPRVKPLPVSPYLSRPLPVLRILPSLQNLFPFHGFSPHIPISSFSDPPCPILVFKISLFLASLSLCVLSSS